MTSPAGPPAPPAPLRHGVVVVHGQGSQEPGEFLASVVNPIANELENAGGKVERDFSVADGKARATLAVIPPASAGTHPEQFEFVEGYWAKSFQPPPPDAVAGWILKRAVTEVGPMAAAWGGWKDPANNEHEPTGLDPSPALQQKAAIARFARMATNRPEPKPPYRAARLTSFLYRLQLTFVLLLLAPVAFLLNLGFGLAIYLLYRLGGTKGNGFFSWITKVAEALTKLNPFFRDTLGDTQRFLEDGMWSVSMRKPVEDAIAGFYEDAGIVDVTIIAHSAGCAVVYDSLALDRRVARAAGAHTKRLTLVTLGSAINRDYGFAGESKVSPYARRLAQIPLDWRITGIAPGPAVLAPAGTLAEVDDLLKRFYWVDIYARMDFVPAGPAREGVRRLARVDPCQLKVRSVLNEDDLLADHFAYFSNTDVVVPRLIRAIYGGEYPWPGDNREQTVAITEDRLRHRTRMVLRLDLLRSAIGLAIVGLFVALAAWGGFQEAVSLVVSAGQDDDLGNAITLPVTAAFVLVAARPVYGGLRDWFFGSL